MNCNNPKCACHTDIKKKVFTPFPFLEGDDYISIYCCMKCHKERKEIWKLWKSLNIV